MYVATSLRVPSRPRERRSHIDDPQLHPFLQVRIPVDEVLLRVPAPKEQQVRRHLPPRPLLHRPLLQEPPHRCEPGPGRDHDERYRRVRRRVEVYVRRTHRQLHLVARLETGEVRGRDAEEGFGAARERWSVHDAEGQSDSLGVPEWGRGDGVLADTHGGEHLEERRECESDVLVLLEDVEDAKASLEHLLGVVGREVLQSLGGRVRVLRLEEDVEVALRRGLLKFYVTL